MKIAIFIDSYKGTMSSVDLSEMVKDHFLRLGHEPIVSVPVSDGGEGFIDSIEGMFPDSARVCETLGPFCEPIEAKYVLKDSVAYVGLYTAAGLALVSPSGLSPSQASTYGVGKIIRDAISKGARKVVLGIGGSATNDGGAGMLQALGAIFYDSEGAITGPMNALRLKRVRSIDTETLEKNTKGVEFLLVSDVTSPLLGKHGAARMFSPQKGADEDEIDILEEAMAHYVGVVKRHTGRDLSTTPSAGAAGGVGFGVMSFVDATVELGIEYLIDLFDIERLIKSSDIVIVGEGRFDRQTKHGKAPYGIAKLSKRHGKYVIGLFGAMESGLKQDYIDAMYVVSPDYVTEEESLRHPKPSFMKMLDDVTLDSLKKRGS